MEQLFGLLLAVLAITAIPIFPPGASDATSDKDMIIASEREWAAAPVKGDASRMAEFMADDYVEIVMETAPGSRKSQWLTTGKTEWINLVRSGREKYTAWRYVTSQFTSMELLQRPRVNTRKLVPGMAKI